VIDEIADVRPAEIHSHLHAWKRMTPAFPERDVDHVEVLLLSGRQGLAIDGEQQEMDLMDVERMLFAGAIFNHPIFH